jgi:hypothetical protein
MTGHFQNRRMCRESEYAFSAQDKQRYPNLDRLLQQRYHFVVLCRNAPKTSFGATFLLASEIVCSNGTQLVHRHEPLTPTFSSLAELEHFIQHNMMNVLHRHFYGRDL